MPKIPLTQLSIGEEIGNSITHGVMAALILLLMPVAAVLAFQKGGWLLMSGIAIFMISLFLMFLSSCLYHSMSPSSKHKHVFQILDHSFIYVAIAGSYTPVALSLIQGWQGVLILIIQWTMVILGILYKSLAKRKIPKASLGIYLTMGWTVVFFMPSLFQKADPWFMALLALGGLLYSVGAWFYKQKHRPYFHFIWHLFVNFAALSHAIAMLFFLK